MILKTKRLELRPITRNDLATLLKLIKEDNKEISRWTTIPFPYTKKNIFDFYKNIRKENDKYVFVIKNKKTKEVMGVIHPIKKEKNNSASIGYWLGEKFRNEGYMTEALKKVLGYCFRKVKVVRIEIIAREDNKASQKVIRKCGLKYEGTLRMEAYNGLKEYSDSKLYSILKTKWEK